MNGMSHSHGLVVQFRMVFLGCQRDSKHTKHQLALQKNAHTKCYNTFEYGAEEIAGFTIVCLNQIGENLGFSILFLLLLLLLCLFFLFLSV